MLRWSWGTFGKHPPVRYLLDIVSNIYTFLSNYYYRLRDQVLGVPQWRRPQMRGSLRQHFLPHHGLPHQGGEGAPARPQGDHVQEDQAERLVGLKFDSFLIFIPLSTFSERRMEILPILCFSGRARSGQRWKVIILLWRNKILVQLRIRGCAKSLN